MTPIHNTDVARTSVIIKTETFAAIFSSQKPLNIASKLSISDVCRSTDYTPTQVDK